MFFLCAASARAAASSDETWFDNAYGDYNAYAASTTGPGVGVSLLDSPRENWLVPDLSINNSAGQHTGDWLGGLNGDPNVGDICTPYVVPSAFSYSNPTNLGPYTGWTPSGNIGDYQRADTQAAGATTCGAYGGIWEQWLNNDDQSLEGADQKVGNDGMAHIVWLDSPTAAADHGASDNSHGTSLFPWYPSLGSNPVFSFDEYLNGGSWGSPNPQQTWADEPECAFLKDVSVNEIIEFCAVPGSNGGS